MKTFFVVASLLMLFSPQVMGQTEGEKRVLDEIRFRGNEVTQEVVMRQEMAVHAGDPFTAEQIEKSRQAIMNLGLFKSVEAEITEEEGRNVLLITVDERFYILPLPTVDYRPDFLADETATNYSYGGELRFDNLFGLNQRLKINYEEKKYVDDVQPPEKKERVTYAYPRIIGTPYSLNVSAERKEKDINILENQEVVATTEWKQYSSTVFLSRWLNTNGASEGWRAGGGIHFASNRYRDTLGVTDYRDQRVVSLLGNLAYVKVDQFPYHRKGEVFDYSVEVADSTLGSDLDFFRNDFTYSRYTPLDKLDANINTRLKLGMAFGNGEPYSLGSSTTLRGYDKDTLQGKLMLLGNFEYQHKLTGYRQLRGLIFADVGNVWQKVDSIDSYRLYSGTGVGMRWRVQSFVDVTLRVDYAYNTDTGETKTYFATSGTF